MEKLHKLAVTAVVFATMAWTNPISANGGQLTIGKLRGYCTDVEKLSGNATDAQAVGASYCVGVLMGFSEGFPMGFMFGTDGKKHKVYCEPKGADMPQKVKVFVNWADRHPEIWHEFWIRGVPLSFREAWPCTE